MITNTIYKITIETRQESKPFREQLVSYITGQSTKSDVLSERISFSQKERIKHFDWINDNFIQPNSFQPLTTTDNNNLLGIDLFKTSFYLKSKPNSKIMTEIKDRIQHFCSKYSIIISHYSGYNNIKHNLILKQITVTEQITTITENEILIF